MSDRKHGQLTVVAGTMFSGKTDRLIDKAVKLGDYGKKGGRNNVVVVFKPTIDTRSPAGFIKSETGKQLPCIDIASDKPENMISYLKDHSDVTHVFIDEAQFFPQTKKFVRIIIYILDMGVDVWAAGLPLDFRCEPFGAMPYLLARADIIIQLNEAHCNECGESGTFPQRLVNSKPANYNDQLIVVGGKDSYEVRCRECHELPGKPTF
ncbi:MAG: thymidine kinase [bacterium]|nr:thymidine kinase [bacterium]